MDSTELTEEAVAVLIEDFIRIAGDVAADDGGFGRQIDLFDAGYLDSLSLVSLTTYIEETFLLPLTEDDLFDPAFTTIAGMARLLATRLAAPERPGPSAAA
ncbi:MAG TPA: phosphopantetheine-binding protein [Streptosporangiaceae bacterium]|nr:phosphopantetheine-binding protein [Streptosporangiaceae bacterium]